MCARGYSHSRRFECFDAGDSLDAGLIEARVDHPRESPTDTQRPLRMSGSWIWVNAENGTKSRDNLQHQYSCKRPIQTTFAPY